MLKKPVNSINGIKLLILPIYNRGEFLGALPLPTKKNTGNFKYPGSPPGKYYQYSPIDLAVAGLFQKEKIQNLEDWFKANPTHRVSENYVSITYKISTSFGSTICNESITEIKNRNIDKYFLSIAPFTFKY